MEKEWKEWITRNLTADELLNLGPCWVKYIALSSNSSGIATVNVHNSQDTSGEVLLYLTTIDDDHSSDMFEIPVFFSQALYVNIGSNAASFIIQYKPSTLK